MLKCCFGHKAQLALFGAEYLPALHIKQVLFAEALGDSEYVPLSHSMHIVLPVESEYFPATHAVQPSLTDDAALMLPYCPVAFILFIINSNQYV